MTRDPHLPSPEVCDWLLAQEWSEPATMHVNGPDCRSEIYECCRATAALGADECIDLVLPADGIEMLREDQRRRLGGPVPTDVPYRVGDGAREQFTQP